MFTRYVRLVLLFGFSGLVLLLSLPGCSCEGRGDGRTFIGLAGSTTEELGVAYPDSPHPGDREYSAQYRAGGEGVSMTESIQKPALAGVWYSADSNRLSQEISSWMGEKGGEGEGKKGGGSPAPGVPVGLVVPHAGYRFSGQVAGRAWAAVSGLEELYSRVLILAPAHRYPLRGVALPNVSAFDTPLGPVQVDGEARAQIMELASDLPIRVKPWMFNQEHSVEVQLPFLKKVLPSTPVVPLLVGSMTMDQTRDVAQVLRQVMGKDTLVVVSTDFSHYGARFDYQPFYASTIQDLRVRLWGLDMGAVNMITALNVEGLESYIRETGITICGRNSLFTALTLLDRTHGNSNLGVRMLGYDTSLSKGDDPTSGAVTYVGLAVYGKGASQVAGSAVAGDGVGGTGGDGQAPGGSVGDSEGEEPLDDGLVILPHDLRGDQEWDEGEGVPEEGDHGEMGGDGDVAGGDTGGGRSREADPCFIMGEYILLPGEMETLVSYARSALEGRLSGASQLPVLDEELITPRLSSRLGAFVTLKKHGMLRGCIGRLTGDAGENPLYRLVGNMAIAAALEDSRFPQVTAAELGEIDVEISVLSPMVPIEPEDVVVGRDGLLLVKGWNRGVLLPQIPVEHGWNRIQYLEFLAQKASLPKDGWRGGQLYAFQAQIIME